MRIIFNPNTLQLRRVSFKTFFYTIAFISLIIIGAELLIRVLNARSPLPAFSIDWKDSYPELDLKLQRLNELEKTESINCFVVGSSMVDAGIEPETLALTLNTEKGNKYHCFNFGLSGAMVETTENLVEFLIKVYSPELIVVGISPIEFDQTYTKTREIGEFPWMQYKLGNFSIEGFLVEHSMLYRVLLTNQKIQQSNFMIQYTKWDKWINLSGFRDWMNTDFDVTGIEDVIFQDLKLNEADLAGLEKIATLQNQGVNIVVVEMPVFPEFFKNYIGGGESSYDAEFIKPVTDVLKMHGMLLIRTQPMINSIVKEHSWYNRNHLNTKGAKEFSSWLGQQIITGDF